MSNKMPNGFLVGHHQDNYTGVTVILCPEGAVGGVDVRGGAPGTHETDCLHNEKMMDKVNAVALCGGSAYGLGAINGVMEYLKEKKIGFSVENKVVPIVPGAVIFDLIYDDYHYPTAEFGYLAAENARAENVPFGSVGAGKSATVGKIRGTSFSCNSGIGYSSVKVGDATVSAIVCVNALGDVIDNESGKILAGAKDENGRFINTADYILKNGAVSATSGTNTTIGCIITDAILTKVQANKIASLSHNALAMTISPVHTDYDGDTLFCLSSSKYKSDFLVLSLAAQTAVTEAIKNAVRK